ncbi:hypothetical protein EWM64_g3478 [Hericium alpestre]|uniref:Uncharacterized protein n=1 Tax=Hericium alpestre TaxID=135208 RepID=A0A4Z0A246_9AGAM|nr:hypothetical protein EWM64_g3478 [Hericium alpestre]
MAPDHSTFLIFMDTVGRLLKLSNSKKNRESIVIPPTSTSPLPNSLSHSTISLPSVSSSPNVSSKLTSAQAELQACESQLAAKEKELDQLRFTPSETA